MYIIYIYIDLALGVVDQIVQSQASLDPKLQMPSKSLAANHVLLVFHLAKAGSPQVAMRRLQGRPKWRLGHSGHRFHLSPWSTSGWQM